MQSLLDVAATPIADSAPCGRDIRVSADVKPFYYQLKDARNAARTEERLTAPGEPIRLSSQWQTVDNLAVQILTQHSRDIEVLAWLAEARLRLRGIEGLTEVFGAIEKLVREHWDDLHSIDGETVEEKVAPLAGLNGSSGEGTLIQPIRLTALIPGFGFAQNCLWDFQIAQRPGEEKLMERLAADADEAGSGPMADQLAKVERCGAAFADLTVALDERCGRAAPPNSNTRNVLNEMAAAIRILGKVEPASAAIAPFEVSTYERRDQMDGEPGLSAQHQPARAFSDFASREAAFEQLLVVARYFRRTEPHSPISMAIETLVRRGRMDFPELLAELLPEVQMRNAVLSAAGIRIKQDGRPDQT